MANKYQKIGGQGLILTVLLRQDEVVNTIFGFGFGQSFSKVKKALSLNKLLVILMHKATNSAYKKKKIIFTFQK